MPWIIKVFTQISKRLLNVELQRLISCQVLNSSLGVVVSLLLYDGKLNIFGLWTKIRRLRTLENADQHISP